MRNISKSATARLFTLAVAATLASACQTWRTDTRPVPVVVEREGAGKIMVLTRDGNWTVVKNSRVAGDSLIGTRTAGSARGDRRSAFALSQIRATERKRFDILRTVALGGVLYFVPALWRLAVVEEE